MCVYKQLTFTTLGGVDVRSQADALDCGMKEDDGVHSPVGGKPRWDFNGVL